MPGGRASRVGLQPEGENRWRLFRMVEEGDMLAAQVPLTQFKEQIAQYGYCLLQASLKWSEQASST
jgi:hypothetical protein